MDKILSDQLTAIIDEGRQVKTEIFTVDRQHKTDVKEIIYNPKQESIQYIIIDMIQESEDRDQFISVKGLLNKLREYNSVRRIYPRITFYRLIRLIDKIVRKGIVEYMILDNNYGLRMKYK